MKTRFNFSLLILILFLSSCNLNFGGNRIYFNSYSTYEEMVEANSSMNEKSKVKQNHFTFKFDIPNYESKYYISGICSCKNNFKGLHADANCPNLTKRELYVTYTEDGCTSNHVALIYKDIIFAYDINKNYYWTDKVDINAGEHEIDNYEEAYDLVDDANNRISGLKILHKDDTLRDFFFNQIINTIKLY